jgi:hypothetical protein
VAALFVGEGPRRFLLVKDQDGSQIGGGPAGFPPSPRSWHQPACKPGSVGRAASRTRDGHSSRTPVAWRLEQPTRTAGSGHRSRSRPACARAPRRPYSVLLPVGFAVPPALLPARCALTAPFHPYRLANPCPPSLARGRPGGGGGLVSVALSLGLRPPVISRHRMSMEPGLSSPATFRPLPERPSGRLTF